jgi:hypothetical protein
MHLWHSFRMTANWGQRGSVTVVMATVMVVALVVSVGAADVARAHRALPSAIGRGCRGARRRAGDGDAVRSGTGRRGDGLRVAKTAPCSPRVSARQTRSRPPLRWRSSSTGSSWSRCEDHPGRRPGGGRPPLAVAVGRSGSSRLITAGALSASADLIPAPLRVLVPTRLRPPTRWT